MVVPVVPRHEPRHLRRPRRPQVPARALHPGARRPGQPARHLAALRALGLAGHDHLRARRHGDRQAARVLLAAVLHAGAGGDGEGPVARRLRHARWTGAGTHAGPLAHRGAARRDPRLHRPVVRRRERRVGQVEAGRRPDAHVGARPRQGGRSGDHAADQKDHGAVARPGAPRHRRRVAGLAQARLVAAGARVSDVRAGGGAEGVRPGLCALGRSALQGAAVDQGRAVPHRHDGGAGRRLLREPRPRRGQPRRRPAPVRARERPGHRRIARLVRRDG